MHGDECVMLVIEWCECECVMLVSGASGASVWCECVMLVYGVSVCVMLVYV